MDLHEALTQISDIRRQIARTETFRGYRSATVAFSGVSALAAAGFQAACFPLLSENPTAFLSLWIGVAAVSVVVAGSEMAWRCLHGASSLAVEHTRLAVEQFLPCLAAGALLTFTLNYAAPETLWMLPGLWSILFSLGVFASCRLLPRPVFCVGVHYLLSGALCLMFSHEELAFSSLAMAVTFGIGQLLAATILYLTLERRHAEK